MDSQERRRQKKEMKRKKDKMIRNKKRSQRVITKEVR